MKNRRKKSRQKQKRICVQDATSNRKDGERVDMTLAATRSNQVVGDSYNIFGE